MQLYSRIKQYYKYRRNWRKVLSRQLRDGENERLAKELDFYSRLIKRDDLCFDIGANIGDKTNVFVRLGAVVVAVEPQESCWQVLKRRF
jgi:16S rRNA A1518/A1519 N6-dimethyltransferase RsmA/KsgA/DIM1 with predicted DNA glycosylase/AP lyase activity